MKESAKIGLSVASLICGMLGLLFSITTFFIFRFYIWIITICVFVILFISGLIGLILKEKRERDKQKTSIKIIKVQNENIVLGTRYIYVPVESPPVNSKCVISKKDLVQGQEIVQCPQCNSLFLKSYLHDWVRVMKICPVCKFVLISLIIDESKIDDPLKEKIENRIINEEIKEIEVD